MPPPRILALAGSLRSDSWNKKLVRIAGEGASAAGAHVTTIDLRDYALPILDEDLEKRDGLHPNARRLKDLFLSHQGLLISSPEYNSSISAALKNAIDWVSRPAAHPEGRPEKPLECFAGKVAGIMAASPGGLGGIRGLVHLRAILGNIRVIVLPDQVTIPGAHESFGPDGTLRDASRTEQVRALGAAVARTAAKLAG